MKIVQSRRSCDYLIDYYYIQYYRCFRFQLFCCDYLIDYYYIQSVILTSLSFNCCDYLIDYYYIQYIFYKLLNFKGLKHILLCNFRVFSLQNSFGYRFL